MLGDGPRSGYPFPLYANRLHSKLNVGKNGIWTTYHLTLSYLLGDN
ncbi:MAG: hypothetical protein ACP5IB_07825 [Thermoplasmata archaeon]